MKITIEKTASTYPGLHALEQCKLLSKLGNYYGVFEALPSQIEAAQKDIDSITKKVKEYLNVLADHMPFSPYAPIFREVDLSFTLASPFEMVRNVSYARGYEPGQRAQRIVTTFIADKIEEFAEVRLGDLHVIVHAELSNIVDSILDGGGYDAEQVVDDDIWYPNTYNSPQIRKTKSK